MSRTSAREVVFQVVFQMDFQNDFVNPDFDKYLQDKKLGDQYDYAVNLLKTICENKESIDAKLNELSTSWPVRRMAKVDLAILRIACAEILFLKDAPAKVSINEAVELAKSYGAENSPKFVNGILAGVID